MVNNGLSGHKSSKSGQRSSRPYSRAKDVDVAIVSINVVVGKVDIVTDAAFKDIVGEVEYVQVTVVGEIKR